MMMIMYTWIQRIVADSLSLPPLSISFQFVHVCLTVCCCLFFYFIHTSHQASAFTIEWVSLFFWFRLISNRSDAMRCAAYICAVMYVLRVHTNNNTVLSMYRNIPNDVNVSGAHVRTKKQHTHTQIKQRKYRINCVDFCAHGIALHCCQWMYHTRTHTNWQRKGVFVVRTLSVFRYEIIILCVVHRLLQLILLPLPLSLSSRSLLSALRLMQNAKVKKNEKTTAKKTTTNKKFELCVLCAWAWLRARFIIPMIQYFHSSESAVMRWGKQWIYSPRAIYMIWCGVLYENICCRHYCLFLYRMLVTEFVDVSWRKNALPMCPKRVHSVPNLLFVCIFSGMQNSRKWLACVYCSAQSLCAIR